MMYVSFKNPTSKQITVFFYQACYAVLNWCSDSMLSLKLKCSSVALQHWNINDNTGISMSNGMER